MAEINDGKGIKVIAYYLPQFHTIPENDRFWGKGSPSGPTPKGEAAVSNHYQPKIPLNQNYYNLMDDKVKIWQSDLAQRHGVFGFCYYHYWFQNGKSCWKTSGTNAGKPLRLPFHSALAGQTRIDEELGRRQSGTNCRPGLRRQKGMEIPFGVFAPIFPR